MFKLNKKTIRQSLTILCIAGFLLNIQASYACAMMPDMEQEQTNCCCGPSHRMDDMAGMHENHSVLGETDHSAQGPECNDPQMGCRIVEVSVGINDPPGDDDDAAVPQSKSAQKKFPQQQDNKSPVVATDDLAKPFNLCRVAPRVEQPEFHPPYITPPLYKSTERYRI
jgi:hypothetical protein